MPRTLWLVLGMWVAGAGCAASHGSGESWTPMATPPVFDNPSVQVRNYDGEVLPPYALNDAEHIEVECLDGQVYEIVDRPQDLYSAANKTTAYARNASADDICDRILTSRTQRRTR